MNEERRERINAKIEKINELKENISSLGIEIQEEFEDEYGIDHLDLEKVENETERKILDKANDCAMICSRGEYDFYGCRV